MKKFFEEFKKFITRGNVVDMAVGVIVGSSFTAIVNGMSNFILKPIINWLLAIIFGKDSLSGILTFLIKVETATDVLDAEGNVIGTEMVPDLAQSIYIDWGSFINAVINFFLIAFVLFSIVKIINKIKEEQKALGDMVIAGKLTREQRTELKANGVKIKDKAAVEAYFAEKKRLADEAAAAQAAADAEKAKAERLANPTTEDLLKMILAEMQNKA
ncbi:MAG: large conductance mechanosensitive channel protein MscL [Clostridia bacterium]|nr:large conductance mechanosensitive channel protein MscL [Clostridia bacterium]